MTIGQSINSVISNYAKFSGRASRSEYWWWVLVTGCLCALFMLVGGPDIQTWPVGLQAIYGVFYLFILLPTLAVLVRRLHDVGKGGGWIFISLVPLIGGIWLLVLMVTPSQPGPNRFGEMPA